VIEEVVKNDPLHLGNVMGVWLTARAAKMT
jgi:hypothetical protein